MSPASDTRDRHLDTDVLTGDIRRRTVHSGLASLLAQGARFVIMTATIGVLGRLLTPRDFGLVTMVMVVTTIITQFRTLGLDTSTVQRETISHAQVNALFWLNVLIGALLASLVALGAPIFSTFYGEPELTAIALSLSALFLIAALSSQHLAVLRRTMRFGRLAIVDSLAVVAAGATGIGVALAGGGYWALVAMHLTLAVMSTLGLWLASPWRPSRPASAPEIASLVRFGAGVAGSNILMTLIRQVDKVLVGLHLSASSLGFYSRGYNLLLIPLQQVSLPITNVATASLSRLTRDETQYRLVYRKAMLVLFSLTIPPCVFSARYAEQAVLGILGDQWHEAVPIFLALVPAGLAWCFHPAVNCVYVSTGRSGREFAWRLMSAIVTIAAFVVGLHWGAFGVAVAFSTCAVLFRLAEIPYCLATSPLRLSDLGRALARPAIASTLALAVTDALRYAFVSGALGHLVQFVILAPLYMAIVGVFWVALPGGRSRVREGISLLTEARPTRA